MKTQLDFKYFTYHPNSIWDNHKLIIADENGGFLFRKNGDSELKEIDLKPKRYPHYNTKSCTKYLEITFEEAKTFFNEKTFDKIMADIGLCEVGLNKVAPDKHEIRKILSPLFSGKSFNGDTANEFIKGVNILTSHYLILNKFVVRSKINPKAYFITKLGIDFLKENS